MQTGCSGLMYSLINHMQSGPYLTWLSKAVLNLAHVVYFSFKQVLLVSTPTKIDIRPLKPNHSDYSNWQKIRLICILKTIMKTSPENKV